MSLPGHPRVAAGASAARLDDCPYDRPPVRRPGSSLHQRELGSVTSSPRDPSPPMTPAPDAYALVRRQTMHLVEGLGEGDTTPQSAEFASPAKWHLAHTTWFFEQFVLGPGLPG